MLNGPSIGAWGLWIAWGGCFQPKNQVPALLGRYLVIPAHGRCLPFPSGIRAGKAAGSFREDILLEELACSYSWGSRHPRVRTHTLLLTFT